MRSRTSCAAMSTFFSMTNVTTTCETPSVVIERSSSMPLIVLTASSTLSVISVSTSSGAAPGCVVVTTTTGKSTFGKRSTPSCRYPAMPMTQTSEDEHRREDRPRDAERGEPLHGCYSTRAPSRTSGPGSRTTLSPALHAAEHGHHVALRSRRAARARSWTGCRCPTTKTRAPVSSSRERLRRHDRAAASRRARACATANMPGSQLAVGVRHHRLDDEVARRLADVRADELGSCR